MSTRQEAYCAADRSDIAETAVVDAVGVFENHPAHFGINGRFKNSLGSLVLFAGNFFTKFGNKLSIELFIKESEFFNSLDLFGSAESVFDAWQQRLYNCFDFDFRCGLMHYGFGFSGFGGQFLLRGSELFDVVVSETESFDEFFFRDFRRTALNHGYSFRSTSHDHFNTTGFNLVRRRVQNQFAVNLADTNGCDS